MRFFAEDLLSVLLEATPRPTAQASKTISDTLAKVSNVRHCRT